MKDCADKTTTFSAIILGIFLFFGTAVLQFFSISLEDFRIAGGIILLIFGIKFVLGWRVIPVGQKEIHSFAAVPFATPLLVGPGTITTLIIFVSVYGFFIPLVAIFINLIIIWFILRHAHIIFRLLGRQGSEVVTRIMGLFITAMAVALIRTGLLG